MENFQIQEIINEIELTEAIKFIHNHSFSPETSVKKICNNFDGRTLGLVIDSNFQASSIPKTLLPPRFDL